MEIFKHEFETEYLRRYGHLDEEAEIEVSAFEVVCELVLPRAPVALDHRTVGPRDWVESHFDVGKPPVRSEIVPRGAFVQGATRSPGR